MNVIYVTDLSGTREAKRPLRQVTLASQEVDLAAQVANVPLDLPTRVAAVVRNELLDGFLQLRGVVGDLLEAVTAAGALELVSKIRETLQRLRRMVVGLRLDLAKLLIRLGEKLASQLVQFQINHHHCARRGSSTRCAAAAAL